MIYLRLVSDLHFKDAEHQFNPCSLDDDWQTILLVAGDVGHRGRAIAWLREMSERFAQVVLVLGNHDFYNYDQYENYCSEYGIELDTWSEKLKNWRDQLSDISNLHLLENQVVELNGLRIIGATLWTDFLDDPFIMRTAQLNMSDYQLILDDQNREPISPTKIQAMHRSSVEFIKRAVQQETDLPTLVLTHHAPTWQCVTSKDYLEDELTHAYSTNLDELIVNSRAAIWAYGHTHFAHQVVIGETLVITNPYGFMSEYTGYQLDQQLCIIDKHQCLIK